MRVLGTAFAVVAGILFLWLVVVRIWAHRHASPCPFSLSWLVDNPVRRRTTGVALDRAGIVPGERVLELGPGPGTFTLAAADKVGADGAVLAVDIQPRMIAALEKKISDAGATNVETLVADGLDLPVPSGSIDRAVLITVLHEIPDQPRALAELRRVLKPGGILSVTEEFLDPDYPLERTTRRRVTSSGFELIERYGDWRMYTLNFRAGASG